MCDVWMHHVLKQMFETGKYTALPMNSVIGGKAKPLSHVVSRAYVPTDVGGAVDTLRKLTFLPVDFSPDPSARELAIRIHEKEDVFKFAFDIDNRLIKHMNLFFAKHVPELLDPSLFVPQTARFITYPFIFPNIPAICWVVPSLCVISSVLIVLDSMNKRKDE